LPRKIGSCSWVNVAEPSGRTLDATTGQACKACCSTVRARAQAEEAREQLATAISEHSAELGRVSAVRSPGSPPPSRPRQTRSAGPTRTLRPPAVRPLQMSPRLPSVLTRRLLTCESRPKRKSARPRPRVTPRCARRPAVSARPRSPAQRAAAAEAVEAELQQGLVRRIRVGALFEVAELDDRESPC
jgi:hypothetical protein